MKNAWLKYENKKVVMDFCEGYKDFISKCKTERECVEEGIRLAEAQGYKNIDEFIAQGKKVKPNDKLYHNHMNKDLTLFIVGSEPMEKGMTILGAHMDSPRLDLKQHPIYEDHQIGLLDTHYYGGIKPYQWVATPLALHGVVCKKDGSTIKISIGENDDEPVFGVSDLLVHLAAKQLEKTGKTVVEGEDLNLTIGSIPQSDEEEAVKKNLLSIFREKYDFEEDDFMSAEIEVVPAGKARDYGLDKSLIMGYGQDDRVCAYTSLMAMFEIDKPKRTCACVLVDKEEIGSVGATGMQSKYFENIVAELLNLSDNGFDELSEKRMLANSCVLSSDVSAAYDPNYPEVNEMKNTCFFGKGLVINKYTGVRGKVQSNDANAEYIAKVRNAFDKHDVTWQTAELGKVNQGGGGTIAFVLASYGMSVLDAGVGVQNMHAPCEITSKVDIYEAKQGYVAFLKEM